MAVLGMVFSFIELSEATSYTLNYSHRGVCDDETASVLKHTRPWTVSDLPSAMTKELEGKVFNGIRVNLSFNLISDEGILPLLDYLQGLPLIYLDLSHNQITNSGIRLLLSSPIMAAFFVDNACQLVITGNSGANPSNIRKIQESSLRLPIGEKVTWS